MQRHTARVELILLELHVEQALKFARIVREQQPPELAAGLYSDVMRLRPTIAEMVRLRVVAAPLPGAEDAMVEPIRRPRPPELLPFRRAEEGG